MFLIFIMIAFFRHVTHFYYDRIFFISYSHLSNNRGGWNKRGGSAKSAKSINVEGGSFWKKLVHKCNKRGVEGEKNLRNQ